MSRRPFRHRREYTISSALVTIALPLAMTAVVCGDDWPAFLGPQGSGISAETGLLAEWPAGGPPVLWKKRVGEGYAAPAAWGDRLVFFHREGDDEVVECLDVKTGATRWRHAAPTTFTDPYGYNGGPRAAPVLSADRCITFGAEGRLTCLDLATGKLIWQRGIHREFDVPPAFFGAGSTPLLDDDQVIVMVGGHPQAGVVAFDLATGTTRWQSIGFDDFPAAPIRIQRDRPPEKLASYASPAIATIHGQRHLLCFMRPGLVSLDPATGQKRFSFWFRSPLHDSVNAAQPVVIDTRIFLSAAYDTGGVLLEVAPDGGSATVVWQDELAMQNHWSTTVARGGFLYGFSGRHEQGSDFRCVRAADGAVMWRIPADDSPAAGKPFYGRGSAIFADGRFIVMGERGTLALVEGTPERFREISRATFAELDHPCWTAPVLANRRLFITGCRSAPGANRRDREEYHLLCLDLAAR
jgi:outer membrane protein assembly factor BamB